MIIKRSAAKIKAEEAHGGAGVRKVLAINTDLVRSNLEMATIGFLKSGSVFDWHAHENVDELIYVLRGRGMMHERLAREKKFLYKTEDMLIVSSGSTHKIRALGQETSKFFFVRVKCDRS